MLVIGVMVNWPDESALITGGVQHTKPISNIKIRENIMVLS
jgi:hypothetical protein